jgi:signal transduction histidine kinase
LVREVANQHVNHAKENGILLLLAIDARIPELLLGDKACLRPLIGCFIINGINQSQRSGGTCTVVANLLNDVTPTSERCVVRFTVKDDGVGLTPEQHADLYNPMRTKR